MLHMSNPLCPNDSNPDAGKVYQTPPQRHLSTTIGRNKSKNTKTPDTLAPVLGRPALVTGRPVGIAVHRQSSTAHVARRKASGDVKTSSGGERSGLLDAPAARVSRTGNSDPRRLAEAAQRDGPPTDCVC